MARKTKAEIGRVGTRIRTGTRIKTGTRTVLAAETEARGEIGETAAGTTEVHSGMTTLARWVLLIGASSMS